MNNIKRPTAVASACSGADAEQVDAERSADPQRSGGSPVKVSDEYSYIDSVRHWMLIPLKDAQALLAEVRRLEQIIEQQSGNC